MTTEVLLSARILGLALGFLVLSIAALLGVRALLRLTGSGWSPETFGFMLGLVAASIPWGMWTLVIRFDGSWSWRIGADAERRTADALSQLGSCWRFHYGMVFYGGRIDSKTWITDIDALAIGPAGLLVLSTKWTGDSIDLDANDEWVRRIAAGAARQAEVLAPMVHNKVPDAPIYPVVVVWGPRTRSSGDCITSVSVPRREYCVRVVAGSRRSEWLERFSGERLSDDQIAVLDEVIRKWIADDEERHARSENAQRRAMSLVRRAEAASFASAVVSLLASGWLIAADSSDSTLRALGRFVHLGGGAGGAALVLGPTAAAVVALSISRSVERVATRARLRRTGRRGTVVVTCGLALWTLTFICSLIGV